MKLVINNLSLYKKDERNNKITILEDINIDL